MQLRMLNPAGQRIDSGSNMVIRRRHFPQPDCDEVQIVGLDCSQADSCCFTGEGWRYYAETGGRGCLPAGIASGVKTKRGESW